MGVMIDSNSRRCRQGWNTVVGMWKMMRRMGLGMMLAHPGYVYRWDPELDTDLDDRGW